MLTIGIITLIAKVCADHLLQADATLQHGL